MDEEESPGGKLKRRGRLKEKRRNNGRKAVGLCKKGVGHCFCKKEGEESSVEALF